ncbi:MAG: hypothetical protein H0Z29_11045 [Candidatus Marinimicrobia bacterium]|nr:hypothetical protein [Candidatus Neomarinimicrobiota bacterium]
MKRKSILILILSMYIIVFSNPIPFDFYSINEIFFRGSGSWDTEILYGRIAELNVDYFPDTIYISNGQKSALFPLNREKFIYCDTSIYEYDEKYLIYLYILHSEDFGDTIKLIPDSGSVKISLEPPFHYTVFVNWGTEKSLIGSPPDGYSISSYYTSPASGMECICYDKTPTIGSFNDTLGTLATMTGFIIDKNGDTISSGNYKLDTPIHLREDKSYVTRIIAGKAYFSFIHAMNDSIYNIPIEPLSIHTYPDSTVECNIYLKEGNSVEVSSLTSKIFK